MTAAALLAEAEANGVTFYLAEGALRYRGELPEPLFARLWAEREAVRKLEACPRWQDLDTWCAHLGAAGVLDNRRVVLREWVEAAGGRHDAAAVHLPVSLSNGLALATLKAHAAALWLEVHEDPEALK